jgi:hypothetical protein
LLVNRPKQFVGRVFRKIFENNQTYAGRDISHNNLTQFWKVPFSAGDKEDSDVTAMVHYVIDENPSFLHPQKGKPTHGHQISAPVEPKPTEVPTTGHSH